jgi:hypothetical protein
MGNLYGLIAITISAIFVFIASVTIVIWNVWNVPSKKDSAIKEFKSNISFCLGDSKKLAVRNTNFNVRWITPCLVIISDKPLSSRSMLIADMDYLRNECRHFSAPYHRPLIAPAIAMYNKHVKGDPPGLDINIEYYISKTLLERKLADGSIIDKGDGNCEIVSL